MSELGKRVLVSVLAVPVVVAAAYRGGAALSAMLGIVAALAAWELFRIARTGGVDPLPIGIGLAAAFPLAVQAHYQRVIEIPLSLGAVLVVALLGLAIWARGVERRPLAAVAVTVFGALYTGGMLSFAFGLRYHRYTIGAVAGAALLAYPLVLTWASDIGAYFVGRSLGRHKLAPAVSPAKTVEGAVGGLLVTMLVAWLYMAWVLTPYGRLALTTTGALLFGAVISMAAQVGDLAESMLKREAGVKDSSSIVPGHGGVLDRVDSLLFVLPVAFLLLDRGGLLQPVFR